MKDLVSEEVSSRVAAKDVDGVETVVMGRGSVAWGWKDGVGAGGD